MKDSEIYVKAASLMESGSWQTRGSCCWAIQLAKDPNIIIGNSLGDEHCKKMKMLYAPTSQESYWMGDCDDTRILALCFMAAIAEGEERAARKRSK